MWFNFCLFYMYSKGFYRDCKLGMTIQLSSYLEEVMPIHTVVTEQYQH